MTDKPKSKRRRRIDTGTDRSIPEGQERAFQELIEQSSLGTPGARALRSRISDSRVRKIRPLATQLSEPYDTFVHVADGGNVDDENTQVLGEWINWLIDFIAGLPQITPDGNPIDFAEAACDAWGNAIAKRALLE